MSPNLWHDHLDRFLLCSSFHSTDSEKGLWPSCRIESVRINLDMQFSMTTYLERPLKMLMNPHRSFLKKIDLLWRMIDLEQCVLAKSGHGGLFRETNYENFLSNLRAMGDKIAIEKSLTIDPYHASLHNVIETEVLAVIAQLNKAWGGKVFFGTDFILEDEVWVNGGLGLEW